MLNLQNIFWRVVKWLSFILLICFIYIFHQVVNHIDLEQTIKNSKEAFSLLLQYSKFELTQENFDEIFDIVNDTDDIEDTEVYINFKCK